MKYLRYTAVLLLIHGGIEILGGLMAFCQQDKSDIIFLQCHS